MQQQFAWFKMRAKMPRSERGPNARKPFVVLLDDNEKRELQRALKEENAERGEALGLGSKLRKLGLMWAHARKAKNNSKKK